MECVGDLNLIFFFFFNFYELDFGQVSMRTLEAEFRPLKRTLESEQKLSLSPLLVKH